MNGIVNVGNTCYFNSALQCMLNIPVVKEYFTRRPYDGPCAFTRLLSLLTCHYWDESIQATFNVAPLLKEFITHFPRFEVGEQHDVQEAILCIIDIIERSVPLLKHYFYGKKVQETVWPGGSKKREEVFSMHILCSNSNDFGEMMKESFKWNVLTDYKDDDDVVHNVATTRYLLSEYPNVLMVSFDKKSVIKITENIVIDNHVYELFATSVHAGIQHGGHYSAFVKRGETWYYIDDDLVKKHELPENAPYYVLMYILKTRPSVYPP